MQNRIECPNCSAKLHLSETHLGQTVKCPRCAKTFKVPDPGTEIIHGANPRLVRRHIDETSEFDDFQANRSSSRAGLWIALLSVMCVGLAGAVTYLLLTRQPEGAQPAVAQAPVIPQPPPVFRQPAEVLIPPPVPEFGGMPDVQGGFAERFGGAPPVADPNPVERVKLSNPRFQKDRFRPTEKLCVDYQFNDNGFGPRVGLVMILKNGNSVSEATLFGLLNASGTIELENFGFQKIPSGTELWVAEGFGLGMGRFGGPQPKRVSNVVVVP